MRRAARARGRRPPSPSSASASIRGAPRAHERELGRDEEPVERARGARTRSDAGCRGRSSPATARIRRGRATAEGGRRGTRRTRPVASRVASSSIAGRPVQGYAAGRGVLAWPSTARGRGDAADRPETRTPYLDALRRATPSATPAASTSRATRAGPAPTPALRRGDRRAGARARHPGRRSRASTSADRARPLPAGAASSPPRPGARGAAGSWSTARRGETTPSAWRSRHVGRRRRRPAQRPLLGDRRARARRARAALRRARDRPRARHRPLPDARGARRGARRDARRGRARSSSPRPTSAPSPTSPALAEVAHARGVPLVVDEAWGAHLHFSSRAARRARSSAAPTSSSPRSTRSSAA